MTTAIGSGDDIGRTVRVQSDGKIVVAGYSSNGSNNDFVAATNAKDGGASILFQNRLLIKNEKNKIITEIKAADCTPVRGYEQTKTH